MDSTMFAALAVDIPTAAGMLGVSDRLLKREIDSGALRAFRLGRRWRVRVVELNAYLGRREKGRQPHVIVPQRSEGGKFVHAVLPLLEGKGDESSAH